MMQQLKVDLKTICWKDKNGILNLKEEGRTDFLEGLNCRAAPRDFLSKTPSFPTFWLRFTFYFRICPPKMHRQFCIPLPKIHRRWLIGPPKMHRRFCIGPPQVSPNLLPPEFHWWGILLTIAIRHLIKKTAICCLFFKNICLI